MNPDEQFQTLQIRCRHAVEELLAGEYLSVFKGRGIEFDEVRHYQPGDEVRSIDWNVTARYSHPYVKVFEEERELTVMLLIDVSYDGEIEDNTSTLTGYTSWLWSRKLQSRFGFTYEFADEIEQTYNAQLSWMISRYLSLQSNGNYTITDDASSWNFNGSLNMVF